MDWKEERDYKMSSVLKPEIVLEEKGFSMLSTAKQSSMWESLGALRKIRAGRSGDKDRESRPGPRAQTQPGSLQLCPAALGLVSSAVNARDSRGRSSVSP